MRHSFVLFMLLAGSGGAVGAGADQGTLEPPVSIRTEHEEIHSRLVALTGMTGAVGAAAKELAAALHPHFVREEEIALPPLALLAPLAAGKVPGGMDQALVMADTLKKEMPRMLAEHKTIRAATDRLRKAAEQEKHADGLAFAKALAQHAQMEEDVLYPAAILVGDLIRARKRP